MSCHFWCGCVFYHTTFGICAPIFFFTMVYSSEACEFQQIPHVTISQRINIQLVCITPNTNKIYLQQPQFVLLLQFIDHFANVMQQKSNFHHHSIYKDKQKTHVRPTPTLSRMEYSALIRPVYPCVYHQTNNIILYTLSS